ncbi:lysophospholipid acyltransferase family protein [Paenibacillus assamensis]|uniref:lysophospholipid acyltransferase family protein n=1 Tax=Paenibacillus assamensis TaxID=311244 RepID=UPI00040E0EA7|nr:lysophospholipid acyltransferase family protein [Paenibacillus assamensis]
MLYAEPSKLFHRLFRWYTEHYLIKRHFHHVGLRDEGAFQSLEGPVLFIMNHCSWWDGLMVYYAVQHDTSRWHYMMMDHEQMSKYRFFRKVGAFSIHKSSIRGILQSLTHSVSLLERGQRVWIFPQGDIYHAEARPLHFQRGAAHILRRVPRTTVVPVTIYYSMCHYQKPGATLLFGTPMSDAWDTMVQTAITERLQQRLERQLDKHRLEVMQAGGADVPGFGALYAPPLSTDQQFERYKRGIGRWKSFFGRSR